MITATGELGGKNLIPVLKKIANYQKVMDWFEKRRKAPEIIEALLQWNIGKETLRTQESTAKLLEKILALFTEAKAGEIIFDEEHDAYSFEIRKHNGKVNISFNLVTSPEYKEAANLYHEIAEALGTPPYNLRMKEETREVASTKELLTFATETSKKGLTIQRYKGLGEMNPQQLWETTMDSDKRTLLQVTVEDSVGADEIFSVLMGDQVEPRKRSFKTTHLKLETLIYNNKVLSDCA